MAIIGGGPGGCSAALSLLRLGREKGQRFRVVLYEPKEFGVHYNQCLGVLSPPIQKILRDEFDLELPGSIVQRPITGYVLHGGGDTIRLEEAEGGTVAVRRVDMDSFLLDAVEKAGAEVVRSRVTALERRPDGITVFSEGEYLEADVAFGCFGMDPGMVVEVCRQSDYQAPRRLETLVTKYPCPPNLLEVFDNHIQTFLPAINGVEFAALTPKATHVSVVLAGRRVRIDMLEAFLGMPEVRQYLPPDFAISRVYKGSFPCRPARNFYDDRFVTVGDAAGLMRSFKGKGINSAVITGALAARTAVNVGISRRAFRQYERLCAFLTRDYLYGRLVRRITILVSHRLSLGPEIRFAKKNSTFRWALTKSVSGGAPYREIVRRCLRPSVALGLLGSFLFWPLRHRGGNRSGP